MSRRRSSERFYTLFKGFLNDYDEYDDDLDYGEIDSRAYSLQPELDKIQPNRDPQLELDYMGNNGNIELIFNFRITWKDRQADIEDYLEEVQQEIENGMNMLVSEVQPLGRRQES